MRSLELGDMQIVARVDNDSLPPPRLLKCLAVIAERLHPEFSRPIYEHGHPDKSKESCILSSLTVRDFLRASGFPRARVQPIQVMMEARKDEKILHALGIGHPEATGPGWTGHLVAITNRWIVDTTLYQAIRPAWPHLPGMMCVPIEPGARRIHGYKVLAALLLEEGDYSNTVVWCDDPRNTGWAKAPDSQPARRAPVVKHLIETLKQQGEDDGEVVDPRAAGCGASN